jgi:hypothetical protein
MVRGGTQAKRGLDFTVPAVAAMSIGRFEMTPELDMLATDALRRRFPQRP